MPTSSTTRSISLIPLAWLTATATVCTHGRKILFGDIPWTVEGGQTERASSGSTEGIYINGAEGTPIGYASQPISVGTQNPTPAPKQSLIFITVSGGPHSVDWNIKWKLAKPSKQGGWIVQEITEVDKSGNPVAHYWEAWQVRAKSQFTIYNGSSPQDDTFQGGPSGDKVSAKARFYEGLHLPSSFVVNPNTWAGILPQTTTNPHLPTNNATHVVVRTWIIP